jgi:hypothetical protein
VKVLPSLWWISLIFSLSESICDMSFVFSDIWNCSFHLLKSFTSAGSVQNVERSDCRDSRRAWKRFTLVTISGYYREIAYIKSGVLFPSVSVAFVPTPNPNSFVIPTAVFEKILKVSIRMKQTYFFSWLLFNNFLRVFLDAFRKFFEIFFVNVDNAFRLVSS